MDKTKYSSDMKKEIDNILEGFHLNEYDLLEVRKKLLDLFSVSNSFISVGEKEPPKHKELIVQSPDGQNYLASWRESYSIFTCQNKGEDSLEWKWKEI